MSEVRAACTKCGALNPEPHTTCWRCGAALSAAQVPVGEQTQETEEQVSRRGVRCPACGQVQTQVGEFCGHCGARLAAPAPDATVSMTQCPRCGTLMPSTRPLCSRCGGPLHLPPPTHAAPSPTPALVVGVTQRAAGALFVAGIFGALPIVLLSLVLALTTRNALVPRALLLTGALLWAVLGPLIGLRMGWHSPPDYDGGFVTGLWVSAAGFAVSVLIAMATLPQLSVGPYATAFWSGYGIFLGASIAGAVGGTVGLMAVAAFRRLTGYRLGDYAGLTEAAARRTQIWGAAAALVTLVCVALAFADLLVGEPPPSVRVAQMGQPVRVGNVEWTVTQVRLIRTQAVSPLDPTHASTGPGILLVGLRGKNLSERMVLLGHANFALRDAQGREYQPAPEAELLAQIRHGETAFSARGIPPQGEVEIWEPFSAPADSSGLRLVIKDLGMSDRERAQVVLGPPVEERPPPPEPAPEAVPEY